MSAPRLYACLAVFPSPEALCAAARTCREAGYTRLEAFTPYPVAQLDEILDLRDNRVSALALAGGLAGALTGFGMQAYATLVDQRLNVGGKPLFSWPAFIPITFELAVLFASFTAVIAMIVLNGLPHLHHPFFSSQASSRATLDRFVLWVSSRDPRFEREATRAFLESLGAESIEEVSA